MSIILNPDTPETRSKLNDLAREQLKLKLLIDISIDIEICKLENWDYKTYIIQIIELLNTLLKK
jgi:hypothetical protein